MKSIKITPNKLRELYEVRKISSPKIAKIYQCDPKNIRHLLNKYHIKIRTKSEARQLLFKINISKKELKKLYQKERLSSPKIAKGLNCSPSFIRNKLKEYNIPIRTIQEALPLSNIAKYPQYNFNNNLKEKAYLIGLRKGDLYVRAASKNSSTVFVSTNSTKLDFIQLIENLFSPYGHICKNGPAKNGAFHIQCSLNRSFNFLLSKEDFIDSWILNNRNCFAAFLAGYTDAEGTFCFCKNISVFSIRSQDKNILHQIQTKLIELGILLRPIQIARKKGTRDIRNTISNKDIWGLWIHRKDAIIKLIKLLKPYIKHPDKQRRMELLKNDIIERNRKYNNYHQRSKWDRLYPKDKINYVRALSLPNNQA